MHNVGPSLSNVFGAVAGTSKGFRYSKAMRDSGVVWNQSNLDTYLTNPWRFVPGSRMPFFLQDPRDRADIIAYLRAATAR
jgi:cytochrome c